MNRLQIKKSVEFFLLEDIGYRDLSSSIFLKDSTGEAYILAKEDGVLSGSDVVGVCYELLDSSLKIDLLKNDRERFTKGEKIASIKGPMASILSGERVVLNLLQRMCGIATLTDLAVKTLNSTHTKICDTRKTTPGLRQFEKYAVRCGGGHNHRYGLSDAVMIKDNHISFSGTIAKAVNAVKEKVGHTVKIEVEIESEKQLYEAIDAGADIIMFDNRSPEEVKRFVEITPSHIVTEASGGINLENLADYSHTGVDYISMGLLTHSVKALDLSMYVKERGL
ncbi:carboxylating nicotinate-nucleotide diphosphorylase [Metabacillus arenae]|uniref:Probable nicotinate-nucleotide pyrophosphorylase [carboxylating] n=1 Tax=Metabacillus arenae TaxID=2771434 RepID=A0A926NBI9_9BACI|nr:carboxylating nicotinate-nucleotide diphosphorylase [Metabacillus arenae]MBD1381217.1 carboxylating nicotinate-nucleotide diphosphorylase [Metabacillus arenae]